MAVRSLALLQLVKRTPFRRRHAFRVRRSRCDSKRFIHLVVNFGATFRGKEEEEVHLGCLPQDFYILAFLGVHILTQQLEDVRQSGGAAGPRET